MMQLVQAEYLGLPVLRRELSGLVLTEKIFPAGHHLPTHTHEKFCFCTILQGRMNEIGKGYEKIYTPMTTIFHPAGEIHYDQFGPDGAHVVSLEFTHQWHERLRPYLEFLETPALHTNDSITWLGLQIQHEFQNFDAATPLALEALALELITRIIRAEKPVCDSQPPKWMKRIEEYLNEHFEDQITLAQLSRIAGVHGVHLIRTFRKFHGTTVGEYLRHRRIEFACRLLQSSSLSVTQVAIQSGFYDQSHFTRAFRAHVGLTPGQFRSQFKSR
jgi:AraC family transcriptional regulator